MVRGLVRLGGAAVVVAIVAAGLVGCGGGGAPPAVSAGFIARASANTDGEEAARFEMTFEVRSEPVRAEGVIQFGSANMVMLAWVRGRPFIEQRLVDGVMYLRLPGGLGREIDTPWVSMDLAGLVPEAARAARSQGGADPTGALASLRGAFGEVESLGADEVRGIGAQRYRVRIYVAEASAQRPRAFAELTPEQLDQLRTLDGAPIDVWIDDQDRIVRLDVPFPAPDGDGRIQVSMVFFDFGTDAPVQAPPAVEVTDVTERFRSSLSA